MARILAIEDEENLRFSIRQSLAKGGHEVFEAATIAEAWDQLSAGDFDAIVTDVNLNGDQTGIDLLRTLRDDGFEGAIIVITAFGTIEKAVEAMKLGADDYLQKPLSLEELRLVCDRALEHRRLRTRLELYERMESSRELEQQVLGQSDVWRRAVAMADRLAEFPLPSARSSQPTLPTILLIGETGAGKGVLARYLHDRACEISGRTGPFVHVNCSALPATLIESELFGHEKGAFTDAKSARSGLFEMADGGTLFLDEIGDMPLPLQAKLLLVVEQGVFRRVGGSKDRRVNARVVAATNQDLESASSTGEFRSDLFYRLNAFPLHVPPLRERKEDVEMIARTMLQRMVRELRRPEMQFSAQALSIMKHYQWPGNVRELINAVQRAVMLCDETEINPEALGLSTRAVRKSDTRTAPSNGHAADSPDNGHIVFDFEHQRYTAEEVEKQLIIQALRKVKGNVSRAAKLIGMNRSSLRYRIERNGLDELVRELVEQ